MFFSENFKIFTKNYGDGESCTVNQMHGKSKQSKLQIYCMPLSKNLGATLRLELEVQP
jgi:hypothetical protein